MKHPRALTVTEINQLLKSSLEQIFPELQFEGEISEVKAGKTGHLYFTVKDAQSQLSAVMWAGMTRSLTFKVAPGVAVLCYARPTVYQARGSLQMVVHRMEQGGEGLLQKRFLELKEKLQKEGLFAEGRKRPLPFLPRAVGIVTSGQGAVIHDMMVKLNERFPAVKKLLVDVPVQGPGAAEEIAAGIRALSASGEVDVIIVARGGGSLEDLWAFNEEVVVRAVFQSAVPVVSGVGHEVDVTLCDFAADVRAPTPTAAAEMVVPKVSELLRLLAEYERRIADTSRWLAPLGQRLDELDARLEQRVSAQVAAARLHFARAEQSVRAIHPRAVVALLSERVGTLADRLSSAVALRVDDNRMRLRDLSSRLEGAAPLREIATWREKTLGYEGRLNAAVQRIHQQLRARLEQAASRFEAVSPQRVLERGFSLVTNRNGEVVRSAASVAVGDQISVRFATDSVLATVRDGAKKIGARD